MPSVKITTPSASVEVEANEMDMKTLSGHAINALREVHKAEDDANRRRAQGIGPYL